MSDPLTKERLRLKDAPEIEGLHFRHGRDEEDFVKMHQVMEISKSADGLDELDNLQEYVHFYKTLSNFDPSGDVLLAGIDEEVIAFNRLIQRDEVDGDRVFSIHGGLIPGWRRRGIGTAMLQAAETRAHELAAASPEHQSLLIESFAADVETGKIALLEGNGYQESRYFFEMVRPDLENIPDAALPGNLEIRPVEDSHIRPIWNAMDEAFRDHWGHEETTEAEYDSWRTQPNQDRSLWCVAWDGDKVAGMVLCFIKHDENLKYDRKRGYTEDISVRRPWRQQGLATALIAQSLKNLKDNGMQQAALGVDTENRTGALRIYERLGYEPTRKYIVYRKALALDAT